MNGTAGGFTVDVAGSMPTLNTTMGKNMTITSHGGSVIMSKCVLIEYFDHPKNYSMFFLYSLVRFMSFSLNNKYITMTIKFINEYILMYTYGKG